MEKLPAASFGFPCGFHKEFLAERARIPESLFDLKYFIDSEPNDDENKPSIRETLMSVSQMAHTACNMVDVDIKSVKIFYKNFKLLKVYFKTLYSSMMVTGGNSLIMGFIERLNHDLAHKCPPVI